MKLSISALQYLAVWIQSKNLYFGKYFVVQKSWGFFLVGFFEGRICCGWTLVRTNSQEWSSGLFCETNQSFADYNLRPNSDLIRLGDSPLLASEDPDTATTQQSVSDAVVVPEHTSSINEDAHSAGVHLDKPSCPPNTRQYSFDSDQSTTAVSSIWYCLFSCGKDCKAGGGGGGLKLTKNLRKSIFSTPTPTPF